ncbi:MAG: hypothetical protein J2P17_12030 [Mycobacterium sp.]|nr:hypothetical protein [Mycobacterium sp.]
MDQSAGRHTLYEGHFNWTRAGFIDGTPKSIVAYTGAELVVIDRFDGSTRTIAQDNAVAGPQGAVYWLSTDNKVIELGKNQSPDEARQVFDLRLPPAIPAADKTAAANPRTRLVAATPSGFLVSRTDYQGTLTAFGNPDILYFVSPTGEASRLGPNAGNTFAEQFLAIHDTVLYGTSDRNNSSACGQATIGAVSMSNRTNRVVEMPAAPPCFTIDSMWIDNGNAYALRTGWNMQSTNYQPLGDTLIEYVENGGGALEVLGNINLGPIRTATAGRMTATIVHNNRDTYGCGHLQLKDSSELKYESDGVCLAAAV